MSYYRKKFECKECNTSKYINNRYIHSEGCPYNRKKKFECKKCNTGKYINNRYIHSEDCPYREKKIECNTSKCNTSKCNTSKCNEGECECVKKRSTEYNSKIVEFAKLKAKNELFTICPFCDGELKQDGMYIHYACMICETKIWKYINEQQSIN